MLTTSGTPERIRFLAAVRRRSCRSIPASPAVLHALVQLFRKSRYAFNGQPRNVKGLLKVAGYLNAVGPGATPSQWRKYLNTFLNENGPIFPFFSLTTNIETGRGRNMPTLNWEEAKELRRWINNDLGFVRGETPLAMPFEALLYRLNELKFEPGWQCEAAPKNFKRLNSSQLTVKIR